jgi:hypothetical protein
MRTMAIKLPRAVVTEAGAIYETTWGLTTAAIFEQLLEELHDSITGSFALEIYSTQQLILMCFTAPDDVTIEILAAAVYTMFPDAQIVEIEDYTHDIDERSQVALTELRLLKNDIYPIQNFAPLKTESLAPVAGVLSQLPTDDRIIIQYVCQRIADTAGFHAKIRAARSIDGLVHVLRPKYWFKQDVVKSMREKIELKCKKKMYCVTARVAAIIPPSPSDTANSFTDSLGNRRGKDPADHLRAVVGALMLVNTPDENGFISTGVRRGVSALKNLRKRAFGRTMALSVNELTTLWHPPKVSALPNTAAVLSVKAGPPASLPQDIKDPAISLFGRTDFREHRVPFGIRREDRQRHMYIVGKSGVGKSCLVELLVKNDIDQGLGAAVLDPHGDLVDNILNRIPEHRLKDVVLFDPTDVNFPPSFNPLADVPTELALRMTLSLVEVFRQAFGSTWNDQIAHVLRYSLLALLSQSGTTLLSLRRFLLDERYRTLVLHGVDDTAVKYFWEVEHAKRRDELQSAAIAPLLNRLGEMFATDMLRNILGQPLNRFDFREIIDNRKILLVKLSKGTIGADNASLLGSIIIAKVYAAAMSRADLAPEERRDFYFYIDEFQNFATPSFVEILSESRKYKLNFTLANQFLGQLSADIRRTLFGNVGNLLTFRVSGEDAAILAQEFSPRFGAEDMINLGPREFYVKMTIKAVAQMGFSGRTLDLPAAPEGVEVRNKIIEFSRNHYSLPLRQARELLALWEEGVEPYQEAI